MFLDLGNPYPPQEGETVQLAAGQHTVKVSECKIIAKIDKVLVTFMTLDGGATYQEWVKYETEGQRKRLGALLGRLCSLSGVPQQTQFTNVQDFDKLGSAIVKAATILRLSLVDEEYEGKVRTKIDGKFTDAILPATAPDDDIAF